MHLVVDYAIHPKFLEVLTLHDHAVVKSKVNVMVGDFHTAYAFIAVIGNRFQDSGLSNLIVEAKILGPNTEERGFHGKHYNYIIIALKLVFEALIRVKVGIFTKWFQTAGKASTWDNFLESQIFQNA